jgi:acyl-coenzyme A thioesterase PaaI-like protein
MRVTDIEFVKLVGIKESENRLSLEYKNDVLNHLKSIHASAQFTLAETQSGLYLQKLFPELVGKVIPLLRDSKIKYKKPALKMISALVKCSDEDVARFKEQFDRKGRSTLSLHVEVKDSDEVVTAVAEFSWFIQKI